MNIEINQIILLAIGVIFSGIVSDFSTRGLFTNKRLRGARRLEEVRQFKDLLESSIIKPRSAANSGNRTTNQENTPEEIALGELIKEQTKLGKRDILGKPSTLSYQIIKAIVGFICVCFITGMGYFMGIPFWVAFLSTLVGCFFGLIIHREN